MPVLGNTAALRKLIADFEKVGGGSHMPILATNLGQEAVTQVQLGFQASKDPYGAGWAPLKRRAGQPLRDTGRLANSFTFEASPTQVRVWTNVAYAGYHQTGTKKMVARKMVPDDDLPLAWEQAFVEAAQDTLAAFAPSLFAAAK